jgi:regulator of protease activity HflC (stomatin/prohibitin superfamily)
MAEAGALKRMAGAIGGAPWRRFLLPGLAALVVLSWVLSDGAGVVEVEPGEVAVLYNNTPLALFGEPARVITEQGALTFIPGFQRVEKLEIRPQILVMEGAEAMDLDHLQALTVRANDGSNFYFEKLEIHYQIIPSMAVELVRTVGPGTAYKTLVRVHAREVLRDAFGQYSFLEVANPATYGQATSAAKEALNERLAPLGIEVTNIPPPKPTFDDRVEHAIEERQNAEQEIEVQAERREKLAQEQGRKIQQVEQTKNQEYQQLVAELEAKRQQAANARIAATREADLYFIEREAEAKAYQEEKVTRAKANEVAYRKEAEALAAKIAAIGEQGADVLNRVIAEKVFPQLERVTATPISDPRTPIDIRYLEKP